MKKSIILEIFNDTKGNIDTMQSPKSRESLKASCKAYDELKTKLSPELFELQKKLMDASDGNWLEEVDHFFVQGFKLGLLVGIECMED